MDVYLTDVRENLFQYYVVNKLTLYQIWFYCKRTLYILNKSFLFDRVITKHISLLYPRKKETIPEIPNLFEFNYNRFYHIS